MHESPFVCAEAALTQALTACQLAQKGQIDADSCWLEIEKACLALAQLAEDDDASLFGVVG